MLRPIHQHVQAAGGEDRRRFLEDFAVCDTSDGCHGHIAPIWQRLRAVIQMRAAEEGTGGQKRANVVAKPQRHPVLDERAEQDFFRQCGSHKDQTGRTGYAACRPNREMWRRNEAESQPDNDQDWC